MKNILDFILILGFLSIQITLNFAHDITKVIVPMAGLGTRLLPLTKGGPKSMVPLVNKPALHHIVEEALRSDITELCFIINAYDRVSIEHYFSSDTAYDRILKQKNKHQELESLNTIIARTHYTYVVQQDPLGLGHAILLAKEFIEPDTFFSVMLPDNIIENDDFLMAELIALAQKYNATIIAIEEVAPEEASSYAIITPKEFLTDNILEISEIIEKPNREQVKPCLASIGRYVFTADIFEALKHTDCGVGGEIHLTDAIAYMIKQGKHVFAYKLQGKRHDIGTTHGFLRTTVSLALHDPLYRDILLEIFGQDVKNSKNLQTKDM